MERIYPTIFGEVVPLTIASTICRRPTCRGSYFLFLKVAELLPDRPL